MSLERGMPKQHAKPEPTPEAATHADHGAGLAPVPQPPQAATMTTKVQEALVAAAPRLDLLTPFVGALAPGVPGRLNDCESAEQIVLFLRECQCAGNVNEGMLWLEDGEHLDLGGIMESSGQGKPLGGVIHAVKDCKTPSELIQHLGGCQCALSINLGMLWLENGDSVDLDRFPGVPPYTQERAGPD